MRIMGLAAVLKVVLPRFGFFNYLGPSPRLWICVRATGEQGDRWVPVLPTNRRVGSQLFVNKKDFLSLFLLSRLDRALESEKFMELETLARDAARESFGIVSFRFKVTILVRDPAGGAFASSTIFESDWMSP